jgi:hypothetical protein
VNKKVGKLGDWEATEFERKEAAKVGRCFLIFI